MGPRRIILQSIALRFRPGLVDLKILGVFCPGKVLGVFCPGIELDRKRSLSYTEDTVREDRTKMAWKYVARM
jgi:hypothetical protein